MKRLKLTFQLVLMKRSLDVLNISLQIFFLAQEVTDDSNHQLY